MTRFHADDIRNLRNELEREFDALDAPGSPQAVYFCATADLPDPAKYRGRMVYDTTAGAFKFSDGVSWA